MIIIDLIYNLTLLVALSVVSGFVDTRWKRNTRRGTLLQGVVFGGAAVIAMLRPLVLAPGLIFDGRSVMISLGTLFFGPWTATIACSMTIPLRVSQGGPGAAMGVLVILASAAIGLGFRLRLPPKSREVSAATLMGFGVVVHLAMLAMTLALPREMIIPVLNQIGFPVMVTYPLATVLIGKILSDQAARGHFLESLQESEQRFRAIFNSTFQLAGLLTPDGILTEANQAALDFAGVKREAVLQHPFWETPWWRGNEARVQQLREAVTRAARGEFVRYEVELQGAGQTTALIDFSIKPIFNPSGQVTLLLPEGRDITERHQAEARLKASEARYRGLFNSMQEGFSLHEIVCDEGGKPCDYRYLEVNPAFERTTGIPRSRWIGHRIKEVLPQIEPGWIERFGQVALTGQPLQYEDYVKELDRYYAVAAYCPHPGQFAVVSSDITERKRAEAALREKTEELDRYFTTALDLLCIADTEGNFRRLNPQWEAVLGYSLEELEGRRFLDLVHPDDVAATIQVVSQLNTQEQVLNFVNRYRCKDGSYRWIEWRSSPRGNLIYASARDITESKRVVLALRETEYFLTRSQAVARLGSYKLDISTNTWICTPALDEIFGIDDHFPKTAESWLQLIVPEQRQEMRQHLIQHVIAEHHRFEREYRIIRHNDGQERWVFGMGEIEFDAQNQPVRMIGTIQDITERKSGEAALRESEERFAVFMENLPAGVFMKEVPGQVVFANRYLCDLFGWGNAVGQTTHELLPLEMAEKMAADDRAVLAHGPATIIEQVLDVANRARVFQTSKFPISREGRPPLLGGISVDITERQQAEEALRSSLDEKVALLKEVHHRVKNNLQIISSLLNLQARKIPSPEVQAFVRDTQSRIHAMALLHEALYGSGNLARISFPQYVNSVCAHVARAYSSESLNVQLRPDIADVSLPLDQAIPAGLIINELVSNALKHAFTGRTAGEISVRLRLADDRHYVLRVVDNGVGFPDTGHPRAAGTLGLRLVENLVQQLEGQMTVERDAGTRFQVVFPRQSS